MRLWKQRSLGCVFFWKSSRNKVREHAYIICTRLSIHSLSSFLRAQFSDMSLEERRERFQHSSLTAMLQTNIALTNGILNAFLHKSSLSIEDSNENTHHAFLLAMMVTNREIAMAINSKDAFVMECMNKMMENFPWASRKYSTETQRKLS